MTKIREKKILLNYPLVGEICRTTDRGFGFVKTPSGEHFIHVSNHTGRKLPYLEGMDGKVCAFVLGGHPRKFAEHKPDWSRQVVRWQLLDEGFEAISAETYAAARVDALAQATDEDLENLLFADWYVQQWQHSQGHAPEAILRPDQALEERLHQRLACSEDLEQLIVILASICESPWFAVHESDLSKVYQQFFRPETWPRSLFVANRPLQDCDGYDVLISHCDANLEEWVRKAKAVTIDLESDGEAIYEVGWKALGSTGRRRNTHGFEQDELQDAIDESLAGVVAPCLIGHNLLGWDWPILQRHRVRLPEAPELWDTLLAAWLLEPWQASHALIVAEHAHTADADAAACYALFEDQVSRFKACLPGNAFDLRDLIERLFETPTLLSSVAGRDYPNTLRGQLRGPTLFPAGKKTSYRWQQHCHIELLAQEDRLADPVLLPAICRLVARKQDSLVAKAIAAVVEDASKNGVFVHLTWLPLWIADDVLRDALRDAHASAEPLTPPPDSTPIFIAENVFRLTDEALQERLTQTAFAVACPEQVAVLWQEARQKALRDDKVSKWFPKVSPSRHGRALMAVESDLGPAWLLYSPAGLRSAAHTWFLLPSIPDWLRVEANPSDALSKLPARIPRWRDGDAMRLDIDHLFVSPDTANRPLYLAELTHCVLNLLRVLGERQVLVLGMRWREEAQILQRNLTHLGVSSEHPGSALRRLEHIHTKGHNVLCCPVEDIPQFLHAAELLALELEVAIDELPLYEWHAILNPPKPSDSTRDALSDEPSDEDDTPPPLQQTLLRSADIKMAIGTFLRDWLPSLGVTGTGQAKTCLLLDERISVRHAAIASGLTWQDMPFYAIEELLDEPTREVFETICYPRRAVHDIPKDYGAYQSFLQQNWGYDDFRPGTQKPAIEKLIQSEKDLLLRLPTGAGKSIIFHLPALLRSSYSGRLSIVITPLRALMRDQAEGLWRLHLTETVDFLSGGRDPWMNHEVYQGVLDGRIRLLFIAPERLRVPRFTEALERGRQMDGGLEFIVFDETHCVSEWGFAFRPDYLHAARFIREQFKDLDRPGNPHRLLLTSATVTQRNRLDLETELGLGEPGEYDDLPEDMPHPIQPFIEIEAFDLDEDENAPSDDKFEKTCQILGALDLRRSAALLFVSRRKDCHRLSEALNTRAAALNSGLEDLRAFPFHAGLSESLKTEACDLLRERRANVLVCTKAFGMGMDIPHLHACIHQRPPTFIEDYLQEVGRIGRDAGERISTGHERVTASLLYNSTDLESNISMIHDKTVQPPDLVDFFAFCVNAGVFFEEVKKSVCLVPSKVRLADTKKFDENQVTNCLFWLERMGVLTLEGRHPPFLSLNLALPKLRQHARQKRGRQHARRSSLIVRIATTLLDVVTESHGVTKELVSLPAADRADSQAQSIFGRVVRGLVRGILALVSSPRTTTSSRPPGPTQAVQDTTSSAEDIDIELSMRELMARCGDLSMDDLFAGLFELSQAGALHIKKSFTITTPSTPSEPEVFELLEYAVEKLTRSTHGRVECMDRDRFAQELRDWYRQRLLSRLSSEASSDTPDYPRSLQWRIDREAYRALRTSVRVLRQADFELHEQLSESSSLQYARSIPDDMAGTAARATAEAIKGMRALFEVIQTIKTEQANQQELDAFLNVPLTMIMDRLGGEVRVSRLRDAMKLLESAGLFNFESDMDAWVSVVTLNRQTALPAHNPEDASSDVIQGVYAEMLRRFELQVLRAQSMVLLAAMPQESRKTFIDGYFECTQAEELSSLLEDTVGEVDDEVVKSNPMLRDLLTHVRQERFAEEIQKLNDDQLAVCKAPFDRYLLVNAGPGSGKTLVLIMRCAHLIHMQRIDPASILVLAFNRAVVYEIRDRIRNLFRELGYGSYANRLDVTTFHSFALRFQPAEDNYEEDAVGEAVHRFADAMKLNPELARSIGRKYKAILIDEFQDMNEDFFHVVESLLSNCSGGGMVIGDDDQDILTWNRLAWRRKHGKDCPMEAVHYFDKFRGSLEPEEFSLTINYRSTPQVVERANGMIEKAASQLGFIRMKAAGQLRAFRSNQGHAEIQFDHSRYPERVAEALRRGDHVAVLCRSNRECREIYESLLTDKVVPEEQIELLGSEDFGLYQLRASGGLLDICHKRKDYDFVESYVWEEMVDEFKQHRFADMQSSLEFLDVLFTLVREESGRPRIRDVQHFIMEMRGSDVERLKAKVGLKDKRARLTIATVHKVKGLEYDSVIVLPSREGFPFSSNDDDAPDSINIASAEEARLYYVAMTRAKDRLYGGWSDRERAWWQRRQTEATDKTPLYCLKGSPGEMFVSLAGQSDPVEEGLQEYIAQMVAIGDPLALRGKQLRHKQRSVGALSGKTHGRLQQSSSDPKLRVANVIRYTCGKYFREHHPDFWSKLHNRVKRQGWFYVVLAEEA